ncbi:MAG TPA: transcription-repair coupling factor [Bacteroidia bacterium]|jgi:transcription-repair coupling factor (superfamily II helicase)|nr:transcription-repair coupling factor [Bacteroidia bacterium]
MNTIPAHIFFSEATERIGYRQPFALKGIHGSGWSFLYTECAAKFNKNLVIICKDAEEALYTLSDLQVLQDRKVLYLPFSYVNAYDFEKTQTASQQQRIETLERIAHNDKKNIVVTYVEALFEKIPNSNVLSDNTFKIAVGEKLSIEFLEEFLFSYHFERVDFVSEPGQFAVRGGIIDVFSFSSPNPYRIELFGEEIESIRSFDSLTQLSTAKHQRILITPDITNENLAVNKICFLDALSDEGTLVFCKDINYLLQKTQQLYEKANTAYENLQETVQLSPDKLFCTAGEIKKSVEKKQTVEAANALYANETIEFSQQPQPSFNKKFDLLFKHLLENKQKGFTNYLYTDTEKQAERLKQILSDVSKTNNIVENLFQIIHLSIHEGFIDYVNKIACYTDHQIFERYHKYKAPASFTKTGEALTLKELQSLNPGDYVVHIDHGIGRFAGLEKIKTGDKIQEAVRLVYKDNDVVYVSITSLHRIAKYTGKEGAVPRLDKLGSTHWQTLKQKTKTRVKQVAFDLIKLYAQRKASKGHAFPPDNYLQHELEASFIYEDTPDQFKSTNDVKRDMEKPYPMDRLVCGDVGFGKTEIAIRAAFKAACDGKQTAILVPTTILAMQHAKTFAERLKDFPCKVDYINRFKSAKEQKESLQKMEEGKTDIIIGTHKLLGGSVKFKNLGLLIIDEEQKFGVGSKDKLKLLKQNVDTLTLTATPIPRTLQFSLMGARDLSVIATPPPNRYPVETELQNFNEDLVRDALRFEISRGGQAFFIHNKVQSINEVAGIIQRLLPEAKIAAGHGQMAGDKLEQIMLDFVEGKTDILVSTTIVESGLDISNANTIIINDAQNFGLSDLHQMRGRVGRSNKKAFCYLLVPSLLTLTNDAKKRLKAITEFTDLGSGFQIAMRDLDIRGAGDMLGAEQSGFINDMGFDTYMKILNEAVEELKEEKWYKEQTKDERLPEMENKYAFSKVFVKDTILETDFELLIPDTYIENITERLNTYKQMDEAHTEEELNTLSQNLIDRFGPMPQQVINLLDAIKMRRRAMQLGFEKLLLKGGKMLAYFISKQDSEYYNTPTFKGILQFAQKHPKQCFLKEQGARFYISIQNVSSVKDVMVIFNEMEKQINVNAA